MQLNRAKIDEALKSFHVDAKVYGPEKKGTVLIYTIKAPGQEEAKLNVYFLNDGGTTFSCTNGKNTPLSEQVATHVKKLCEVSEVTTKALYIKKMDTDEYNILCDFLKERNCTIASHKNLSHGEQFKITEPYGGHLLFNRYTNGSFQVQGNNAILKSWVIEGLTELLPYKDVIGMQLASMEVEITTDQAISGLKQRLPMSYAYLGETLVAIISPSIALSTIEIELSDYTSFVFPALRGLEGYIKKLFKDRGVNVTNEGFGSFISGTNGKSILNESTKKDINSPKHVKAIEESYNYFKGQRHGLFHVDGVIETTRVIESKKEAEDILNDIFNIIEQTYVTVISK